jgi:hypothetical protein
VFLGRLKLAPESPYFQIKIRWKLINRKIDPPRRIDTKKAPRVIEGLVFQGHITI